ncbi:putative ATP-dependent RNA helicase DHR1 [Exophiala xenobiotica]|uniref:RNA helicase n=1 Tax=Lithohypha guttulata TaxID=1690604 RepID=A0ABR0KBW6_9EURO|nr:putative ATP-dependent RNA helicase DHR1 [Lithohypha guttulata]KAK5326298.1 putative ATP-dependent RNA helicase DHR1 [Exophiala xenobiotica]
MPSKFKPTREHKHRKLARESQPGGPPTAQSESDPNATVITPAPKSERDARKEDLRNELRAQQPKVSAKKQKRLDKYIEKKLKKDEAADLVRKLEQERERYDASAGGLRSSKHLKRKFGDFVDGQVARNAGVVREHGPEPQLNNKQAQRSRRHARDDGIESMDEFEEEHQHAFDPATAPDTDDAWLKQRAPPVQGTGLAQQLQIGANGLPVIPVRNSKRRKDEQAGPQNQEAVVPEAEAAAEAEESWEGFSDTGEQDSDIVDSQSGSDDMSSDDEDESEDEKQVDSRLKDIDSNVLDALLAELERSGESSEEDAGEAEDDEDESQHDAAEATSEEDGEASDGVTGSDSSSDDGSETSDSSIASKEDARIKPRTSAFKSWATQQLNQSMGHTPFYEQSQLTTNAETEPQRYEKPAAGYRLGVKELEGPKTDRRAYTVTVQRTESIQETRSQLPILQHEQEIMEAIHNNPVVIIKGDTGSGKTTQLPQFLLEAGFGDRNGPHPGMIGITQPRRVAAVSMAKRVGEELGDHGDQVAHQIRFDTNVSTRTAIKFMTDGILLRELSQDLLLKKYSAIVIDEAHERSVNTDLLIGMLSKIVPARMKKTEQNPHPRPLKLIIMSATLNIGDFLHEKLFSNSMRPPVVEAEGRQHRVTTHFALRSRPDYVEETIQKVKRAHRKLPRGGILVFLTGQNEIKYVLSRLRQELGRSAQPADDQPRMHVSAANVPLEMDDLDFGDFDRTNKVVDEDDDIDILTDEAEADKEFEISDEEEVTNTSTSAPNKIPLNRDPYDTVHLLPLYSQLPTKEQLRVFQPPPDRARMIVLATNVAETSLTIPNIRYVFDCGRSKERRYNTETSVQSFEVDYISKASAQQRAGRAGRTGPGHCWRLYSSALYEQFFPDHTGPEILRTPAESVVLQLKGFRYPRPVIDFPFPSPPSSSMLQNAEKLLRNLGAIEGQNGMLTELGKKLSLYPLSPRLGKILVNAIEQPKILEEVLFLTAALSVDDVFVNQAQLDNNEDDDQDNRKQAYGRAHAAFSKHDKSSDALKTLTAVQMYLDAADKESFCQQCFLRPKAMSEITQLFNQLRSMVHANHPTLKLHNNNKLTTAVIAAINKTTASGYIDQVALRYDLHPTPPVLPKRPTRTIDVPYLPLTPLHLRPSANTDIIDKAVFIHPSSLLSRLSTKSLPDYVVYRHLQTSQPSTVSDASKTKTRMIPLCPLDATALLSLIRDTGLIEYGKPVPKTRVEDVPNTRPKERVCWVSTEVKSGGSSGAMGWPLPPTRVRQVMDLKSANGWRVVEVLA